MAVLKTFRPKFTENNYLFMTKMFLILFITKLLDINVGRGGGGLSKIKFPVVISSNINLEWSSVFT